MDSHRAPSAFPVRPRTASTRPSTGSAAGRPIRLVAPSSPNVGVGIRDRLRTRHAMEEGSSGGGMAPSMGSSGFRGARRKAVMGSQFHLGASDKAVCTTCPVLRRAITTLREEIAQLKAALDKSQSDLISVASERSRLSRMHAELTEEHGRLVDTVTSTKARLSRSVDEVRETDGLGEGEGEGESMKVVVRVR
jgi:hypothetical protein